MDKITDVLEYEYTKSGGYITVKFDSGWITKRKFTNIQFDGKQRCDLLGRTPKQFQTGVYISIKRRGYSRYRLSQDAINKCLTGDSVEVENETEFQTALRKYMTSLKEERKILDKEDESLREAVRIVKFKRSKLGQRMSASYKLMELVTEG